MDEAQRREDNRQVLLRLFRCLNRRDYEGALQLVADEVTWEMPFAPPALPAPFNRQRFENLLHSWPVVFAQGLTFDDVNIQPMLDPDRLVIEFRGEAVMAATGQPYRNRYVGLFQLSDRRIVHAREYFDSAVAIRAFGWPIATSATH